MQVGSLIKNGNNTGVVIKVYEGLTKLAPLYEIRWLKTNTVSTFTKAIMDLYGMEVINESR